MKVLTTGLEGVVIIETPVFADGRGFFSETFREDEFAGKVCSTTFVQENESRSRYGVLRGLHYQLPPAAQGKLVRVVRGAILDVAVDIRRGSPTFGKYFSYRLNDRNRHQMFIPRGFAHGFLCLTDEAVVVYKCDGYYSPAHEASLAWDDPEVGIDWGVAPDDIILSDKDSRAPSLGEARLFDYREKPY